MPATRRTSDLRRRTEHGMIDGFGRWNPIAICGNARDYRDSHQHCGNTDQWITQYNVTRYIQRSRLSTGPRQISVRVNAANRPSPAVHTLLDRKESPANRRSYLRVVLWPFERRAEERTGRGSGNHRRSGRTAPSPARIREVRRMFQTTGPISKNVRQSYYRLKG